MNGGITTKKIFTGVDVFNVFAISGLLGLRCFAHLGWTLLEIMLESITIAKIIFTFVGKDNKKINQKKRFKLVF